ncbi:MAG: hypothetical protein KGS60_04420 [Verrucomicrobia bacterium]|jgi:hypothetical protein|nr:hypothetical protein [Verrucomicrobiota bacterium]
MQDTDYFQVIHDKNRNEWRIHVSDAACPPELTQTRRFHEGHGFNGLRTAVRCYQAVATSIGAGFKVVHHLPNGNLITEVFDDRQLDFPALGMDSKQNAEPAIDFLSN